MSVVVRAALLAALVLPAPAAAHDHDRGEAHRSLRPAVTDQNFYFVMADRFANGDDGQRHGGLPPGKLEGQSGFDPTGTGWYHGGDLKGLRERLDYIKGLGTTALWLTPSFKNKAVQPEDISAGYHGYWITDFTQIDPHLGHQRGSAHADRRRPLARHQGLLRHHHQPHRGRHQVHRGRPRCRTVQGRVRRTARRSARPGRSTTATTRARTTSRTLTPTGQPSCDRRPGPAAQLPLPPVRAGLRAQRQGPGLAQRRPPTTTAATRRSSARTRSTATSSASTTSSPSSRASSRA